MRNVCDGSLEMKKTKTKKQVRGTDKGVGTPCEDQSSSSVPEDSKVSEKSFLGFVFAGTFGDRPHRWGEMKGRREDRRGTKRNKTRRDGEDRTRRDKTDTEDRARDGQDEETDRKDEDHTV